MQNPRGAEIATGTARLKTDQKDRKNRATKDANEDD